MQFNAFGQEDNLQPLTITIGDTIVFADSCEGNFQYIDMYTKTRYIDTVLRFNPETGEGFYATFFGEGDFDAKRLNCTYAGRKFTIVSTQNFEDKNTGETRFVIFVVLDSWKQVAWIEFIDAIENGEIRLVPQRF